MEATNTHPKDKGKNYIGITIRKWHTYIYKLAQLPTDIKKQPLTNRKSVSYGN